MSISFEKRTIIKWSFLIFVSAFIFIDIYKGFKGNLRELLIFFALSLAVIINDYIRITRKESLGNFRYVSLLITILAANTISYFVSGFGPQAYIFFSLSEIFSIKGKRQKTFFILHAVCFFTVTFLNLGISEDSLSNLGITYFGMAMLFYTLKKMKIERDEINELNMELNEVNTRLFEYSTRVKELTISKERTLLAQELHDSLGHSLMALKLHLEYARKVFDTNPENAKDVLSKAESIANDSIKDLRKAVNILKEPRIIQDLKSSINELIENFRLIGNIKINLEEDVAVEQIGIDIKNCIYKTIQEALTNSVKHGKASKIYIKILRYNKYVRVIIKDNGTGCSEIIKSNGLKGIENRITALKGIVNYDSGKGKNSGFMITADIPVNWEE